MSTHNTLAICIALTILLGTLSVAKADDWDGPTSRSASSASGEYHLLYQPGTRAMFTNGRLTLRKGKNTQPVFEWAIEPFQAPAKLLVSKLGQVVLVDQQGKTGYRRAVVVYNPKGVLVTSLHLDEILSAAELTKVKRSISSRWWLAPKIPPRLDAGKLVIQTDQGHQLTFDLATGKQYRDKRLHVVPSLRQRFVQFTSGTRQSQKTRFEIQDSTHRGGSTCHVSTDGQGCEIWASKKMVSKETVRRAQHERAPLQQEFQSIVRQAKLLEQSLMLDEHRRSLPGPHVLVQLRFTADGYEYVYPFLWSTTKPLAPTVKAFLRQLRPLLQI